MSHCLYSTRLHWSGTHGFAKLHGVLVCLSESPTVGLEAVASIDYTPEIRMRTIRPAGKIEREMSDAEVTTADALLRKLTA